MAIETMLYCGSFDLVACELTFVSLLMSVDFVQWPIFSELVEENVEFELALTCRSVLLLLFVVVDKGMVLPTFDAAELNSLESMMSQLR
jgi:hypothetical protein